MPFLLHFMKLFTSLAGLYNPRDVPSLLFDSQPQQKHILLDDSMWSIWNLIMEMVTDGIV